MQWPGYDPVSGDEAAAAGVIKCSVLFILQGDLAAREGASEWSGPHKGAATHGCIGCALHNSRGQ